MASVSRPPGAGAHHHRARERHVMNDLRSQLRDADPLAREGGMAPADVERMRRRVLSAEREPQAAGHRLFFVLAATLVVAGIGGALLTRASLSQPDVNLSTTPVVRVEQP